MHVVRFRPKNATESGNAHVRSATVSHRIGWRESAGQREGLGNLSLTHIMFYTSVLDPWHNAVVAPRCQSSGLLISLHAPGSGAQGLCEYAFGVDACCAVDADVVVADVVAIVVDAAAAAVRCRCRPLAVGIRPYYGVTAYCVCTSYIHRYIRTTTLCNI